MIAIKLFDLFGDSRACHLSGHFIQVCICAESFSLLSLDGWLHGRERKQLCSACALPLVTAALAVGTVIDLHRKNFLSISAVVGPL